MKVALRITAAGLLLVLLTAAEWAPTDARLVPVPFPDHAGLEAAVSRELAEHETRLLAAKTADEARAALAELALLFHAHGFIEPALAADRDLAILAPEDPRWPDLAGHTLMSEGRLAEARVAFEKALARAPRLTAARVGLAEIDLLEGRPGDAEERFRTVLADEPASAAARFGLGRALLAQNRPDEALEELRRALEIEPRANRIRHSIGLALRRLGRIEAARAELEAAGPIGVTAHDPFLAEVESARVGARAQILEGKKAFAAGAIDAAIAAFRHALDADPESVAVHVDLGVALATAGRTDEAAATLRRAVDLDPESATARYDLGHVLLALGRTEEALAALSEAVRLEPDRADAQRTLAAALRRAGRAPAALAPLEQAIAIDPADLGARLERADLLAELGRWADARAALEEVLALDPVHGPATAALARLLATAPEPTLRDGERALELALSVFRARPDAAAAETVALALTELDRCTAAQAWLRRALELATLAGTDAAAMEARLAAIESSCRP